MTGRQFDASALMQGLFGLAVLAMFATRYRHFITRFCRFVTGHVVLFGVMVMLYLMIFGLIGSGLGLPKLFWNEFIETRFFSAWAATLLLGLIGTLAYYLDPLPYQTTQMILRFEGQPGDARTPPAPASMSRFGERWLWPEHENGKRLSWFLRASKWPFLALLAAQALLPRVFIGVPRTVPVSQFIDAFGRSSGFADLLQGHLWANYALSAAIWLLGISAGVLTFRVFIKLSSHPRAFDRFDHAVERALHSLGRIFGMVARPVARAIDRAGGRARSLRRVGVGQARLCRAARASVLSAEARLLLRAGGGAGSP